MRRKMVWVGVSWLAGLLLAETCQRNRTVFLLLAAWMLLGAFRLFRRLTTGQTVCVGVSLTMAVVLSFANTAFFDQPILAHEGKPMVFSGRIVSVQVYDNDRASYQVKGSFADGTNAKILVYTDDLGGEYGDVIRVAGNYSQPDSSMLWDGAAYYRGKEILLQADSNALVRCVHTERGTGIRWLQSYRSRISARIQTLAGTDAGGMVSAMLLGTRNTVEDTTKNVLSHDGIRHVLSVSGLHLVLLLFFWEQLGKRLHLHRWLRFLVSVLWIVLYALLVEAPVSILRAGLMALLVQSAPLCYRKADCCNSLCFAAVLLTIGNPHLVTDASFLLSVSGAFGAGVFAPWMTRRMRKGFPFGILKQFCAMACVSICIFPVSILFFDAISILSPVANLLLVPLCSWMLLLSLVIFLTGGVGFLAKPICVLLQLLYDLMMLLAKGMQTLVPMQIATQWQMLPVFTALLLALVLLIYFQKRTPRAVAAALSVSILFLLVGQTVFRHRGQSVFTVAMLGQGQELVLVMRFQGKTDVIDLTGHHKNPDYVQTYLERQGVSYLDSLCLTENASQMRVTYPAVLETIQTAEAALPEDCWLPPGKTLLGAVPLRTDAWKIEDTQYCITLESGIVKIQYGTLQFCIGTALYALPDGVWDAAFCTAWRGNPDEIPEQLYQKETAIQLQVPANGDWIVEELT